MTRTDRKRKSESHIVTQVTGDYGLREIEEIAERVRRLLPSHRDPERFHVEKSEIEADLRRLARVLPPAGGAGTQHPEISPALGVFGPKLRGRKG